MITNLTIIDGLFEDPSHVRDFALEMDFSVPPVFDGVSYPGFAQIKEVAVLKYLEAVITEALGANVEISGAAVTAGTEDLSTRQWIHSDNTCATYAGVIYLFDKPGFGTAFWKHRETGTETLSEFISKTNGAPIEAAAKLQTDGIDHHSWYRTDYAESRFNRFIFYPSDRFHSRWPEKAFGDQPSNCRLTIAMFFSIS